jgi:hypothetical protein
LRSRKQGVRIFQMDKFFALKLSSNNLFLCLVELQKLEFEVTCKLSSTYR